MAIGFGFFLVSFAAYFGINYLIDHSPASDIKLPGFLMVAIVILFILLIMFLHDKKAFINMIKDFKSGKMSAKEFVSFVLAIIFFALIALGIAGE